MSNVEYSTTTVGDTMTDTFIWTVPDFLDDLNYKSIRELRMEKPENAAADWSGSRFQLKMRFLGRYNDIIEVYYLSPISLIKKSEFKVRRTSLERASRARERLINTKDNYINQGNQWQYLGRLFKHDIIDNISDNDDSYIEDYEDPKYSLRLIIKFTVHKNYDSGNSNVEKSKVAETELTHHFGQLLTSGLFSDATMKSVEGNEYKVHKVVLASRSAVLKAHFEHNTTECQTNIIESHFEDEVLKEVLTFIYSTKAPRVDEIPEKLLAAADFYQLNILKSWCEEVLCKKLTTENVVETLELAELYSAEKLIQSAVEFIAHNQTRQIIETERWAKLTSELVKKIFKLYVTADN